MSTAVIGVVEGGVAEVRAQYIVLSLRSPVVGMDARPGVALEHCLTKVTRTVPHGSCDEENNVHLYKFDKIVKNDARLLSAVLVIWTTSTCEVVYVAVLVCACLPEDCQGRGVLVGSRWRVLDLLHPMRGVTPQLGTYLCHMNVERMVGGYVAMLPTVVHSTEGGPIIALGV